VASVVFFTFDGISAFIVTGFTTQITKVWQVALRATDMPTQAAPVEVLTFLLYLSKLPSWDMSFWNCAPAPW